MAFCSDIFQSIRGNCRECMTTPMTRRRLIIIGAIALFVVIFIIILTVSLASGGSSSTSNSKGSQVLTEVPLTLGSNNFLRDLKGQMYKINQDNSTVASFMDVLAKGKIGALILNAGANCKLAQYKDSVAQIMEQIDVLKRLKQKCDLVQTANDIRNGKPAGKISILLGLDGGYAIDSRVSLLRIYYELGVRVVSVGGPCSTPWSISASDTTKKTGLTPFGIAVVKEMNRLGIIIDLSGSNDETRKNVFNNTRSPVIFSASNANGIAINALNLDNITLEALKKNDGLVMLSFRCKLLSAGADCDMNDVVKQLNYIAAIVGVERVGLGGDFGLTDETYPKDIPNEGGFPALFDRLRAPLTGERQWSIPELKNLAFGNFRRVMIDVEKKKVKEVPFEDLEPKDELPAEKDLVCYTDMNERYSLPTPKPTPATTTLKPTEATKTTPKKT